MYVRRGPRSTSHEIISRTWVAAEARPMAASSGTPTSGTAKRMPMMPQMQPLGAIFHVFFSLIFERKLLERYLIYLTKRQKKRRNFNNTWFPVPSFSTASKLQFWLPSKTEIARTTTLTSQVSRPVAVQMARSQSQVGQRVFLMGRMCIQIRSQMSRMSTCFRC